MIAAGEPARAYQPCRLKSELSCAKLQKLTKYAYSVSLYSTSTTRSESVFRLGGGVGVRLIPGVGGVDVLPCPCPIRKRVCISGYIVRQQRAPPPFTYLPEQKSICISRYIIRQQRAPPPFCPCVGGVDVLARSKKVCINRKK